MDGYTVEEAASVLGVPRERVWELLARGILSGSTDLGGGMRVRLKADPPVDAPAERSTNGGSHPTADPTPFRELLTEFRSLTERYGQALLALGEARGEVASLRSRVDLLEARVDLRLPAGSASTARPSWSETPWPTPAERVAQPALATPDSELAPARERDDERGSHRRRPRSGRRATGSFAEALARAQDPSPPELPGAEEAAAALAALRAEHGSQATRPLDAVADADVLLPRDLPSAEAVPVADEESSIGPAPDLASAAAEPQGPPATAEMRPIESEEAALGTDPARSGGAEEPAESEPATEPAAVVASGPAVEPSPEWDRGHYSAAIGEPEWISADDVEPVQPVEIAAAAPVEIAAKPPVEIAAKPPVEIAAEPPPVTFADATPAAATEPEEEIATDEGGPVESSGSPELDEGLAALEALANPPPPAPDPEPVVPDAEPERPVLPSQDWRHSAAGAGGWPSPEPPLRPRQSSPFVGRSSASRAYRRLRRIFPT